jgi:hypothetical protein
MARKNKGAISKMKKIILLFFLALLIVFSTLLIVGVVLLYNWEHEEFMPGQRNMTSIKLGNTNKLLYLKARGWGIAGNHEEIVLSQSDSILPNKTEDYIFYTSIVFYKLESDSNVIIYAPKSSISEPVNKIPNVTIKGLKTFYEIKDYNTNYQKYGLQRISVYEQ